MNPMRDNIEGVYRGGEGKTLVTTACPEGRLGVNEASDGSSWKVKNDYK